MSDMELNTDSVGIKKQKQMYVYVLKLVNGKHYTGMTEDLNRRLREHKAGSSKSTRRHLPLTLEFVVRIEGRKAARVLEVRIKNRGAGRWLNQLKFSKLRYEYDIATVPKKWETSPKEKVVDSSE